MADTARVNISTVEIRICRTDELQKLQLFLHEKWKAFHILSTDTELLNWQHNNQAGYLNFVVAHDTAEDKFIAILGFIPTSHFDQALIRNGDIWLAIWKVDDQNASAKGVGLKLLDFLDVLLNPKTIGAIGINSKVKKVYQYLGFTTGVLMHYYIQNSKTDDYSIASFRKIPVRINQKTNSTLLPLYQLDKIDSLSSPYSPEKTVSFLIHRYAEHPSYQYLFYGAYQDNFIKAIFVVRKIQINQHACLRIVDILGDLNSLDSLEFELNRLVEEHQAEYVDCMNYGIAESDFYRHGFSRRSDDIILPNYFEPFEKKNIDIEFAIKANHEKYVIFKGDSDQDRPSII